MAFIVPEGWDRYHRQIKSSVDTLIRQSVFSGISQSVLSTWWKNFKSSEEKYLAAHLLDSMVYRTEEMLKASCHQVVQKILPEKLEKLHIQFDSVSELEAILKNKRNDIVFSPIVTNTPGKSGEALLRLFAGTIQLNGKNKHYIRNWVNFHPDTKVIVLLDDMVGTGNQFCTFYKNNNLSNCKIPIIFIPFFAHESGIQHVNRQCPNVQIAPIETLGTEHNFFREDKDSPGYDLWARDKQNKVKDVKKFYEDMLKANGISCANNFGYGGFGLTVYTNLSTPNNSLHIFYTNKNVQSWIPLLTR